MKHDTHTAVRAVLARHFGVDTAEIELQHELRRDWGLATAELAQLTPNLERIAGVHIRAADLSLVTTVAQLIRLLEALQARSAFERQRSALEPFAAVPRLRALR